MAVGLEVWLNGTPTELDNAEAHLATAGRITQRGDRWPLFGERGRYRQYLRVAVTDTRRLAAVPDTTERSHTR